MTRTTLGTPRRGQHLSRQHGAQPGVEVAALALALALAASLGACSGDEAKADLDAGAQSDSAQTDGDLPDSTTGDALGDSAADTGLAPGEWPPVTFAPDGTPPKKLSATGLARIEDGKLVYHPELVAYELTMPLFSDYALKSRALWVPKGKQIQWHDTAPLKFPEGSVIVKSFLFPDDLRKPTEGVRVIETRVLVKGAEEWKAWPYVWDEPEPGKALPNTADAVLKVTGTVKDIAFVDLQGKKQEASYLVPQRNQCKDCHDRLDGRDPFTTIIGPRARFMNRDHVYAGKSVNQLSHLQSLGLLAGMPALAKVDKAVSLSDVMTATVDNLTGEPLRRATRDYLDMNCAHCHSPTGVEGETSQLYLNHDNTNAFLFGVCKAPSSAGKGGFGRSYDIVPGQPDKSILVYRLETTELGAMMPDIGRSLVHGTGVALVRKWIEEMAPVNCDR